MKDPKVGQRAAVYIKNKKVCGVIESHGMPKDLYTLYTDDGRYIPDLHRTHLVGLKKCVAPERVLVRVYADGSLGAAWFAHSLKEINYVEGSEIFEYRRVRKVAK